MNTPTSHYHGFVDTLASMGITKEAADAMYKQAAGAQTLINILRQTQKAGKPLAQALYRGKSIMNSPTWLNKIINFITRPGNKHLIGKKYFANQAELDKFMKFIDPLYKPSKAINARIPLNGARNIVAPANVPVGILRKGPSDIPVGAISKANVPANVPVGILRKGPSDIPVGTARNTVPVNTPVGILRNDSGIMQNTTPRARVSAGAPIDTPVGILRNDSGIMQNTIPKARVLNNKAIAPTTDATTPDLGFIANHPWWALGGAAGGGYLLGRNSNNEY